MLLFALLFAFSQGLERKIAAIRVICPCPGDPPSWNVAPGAHEADENQRPDTGSQPDL